MVEMSTVEMQIAARSREKRGALTNLHQFIGMDHLYTSFNQLNKKSASGVDGETWQSYEKRREERIPQLLTAFKSGSYRAPSIRRAYIPKGDGKMRPLGLPTIEDKLLQMSVTRVLQPVYEEVFYDCSYGFRPGKSQHKALDQLFQEVSFKGMRYIIDADMRDYFGSIDHSQLRDLLDRKIKDGVIRRMIDKWLKAGVLEEGQLIYPKSGTPQGGTVSPVLSNVYLHYVLDEWFIEQIQTKLRGRSFIIRFADDFLLGFTHKEDAERVMKVLPHRLDKYGLTLHPEKTQLISLAGDDEGQKTFDFLGFTHYMGKSKKGKAILKRKTSRKKLILALNRSNEWIKRNRHIPVKNLIEQLNVKLVGHYRYYGITFNSRSLNNYLLRVEAQLFKWLNRRGGKNSYTWEEFNKMKTEWIPIAKPKIYHKYQLAKP